MRLRAVAALVGLAGVLALAGAAVAAASTVTTTVPALTSPARTVTLPARTVTLRPRVVSLKRRVRSIAPMLSHRTFTVGSDVLFAFDSAVVSPDAKPVLASVVRSLRRHRTGVVTVDGYTDSIGGVAFNLGLSRRRANSVRALLAGELPAGLHYVIHGYGKSHPVATNATGAGRQQNRRVTVSYASG